MSTRIEAGTTEAGTGGPALSEQQRDALTDELFDLHRMLHPGRELCFCGDDRMLLEGVRELRERVERELGDDEPER